MNSPLRTAMWTLGAGTILVAAAALSHDEGLHRQIVAALPHHAASPAVPGLARVRVSSTRQAPETPRADRSPAIASTLFRNASSRTEGKKSDAPIQIGPLVTAVDAGQPPVAAPAVAHRRVPLEITPRRVVIDAIIVDVALPESASQELDWDRELRSSAIEGKPRDAINLLRAHGRVAIIATNRLFVIDGEWAELQWSQRLGSPTGGARPPLGNTDWKAGVVRADSGSELQLAAEFRIRPSILANGRIRLEVHPQSSRRRRGSPLDQPELTTLAFTTDLVVREGATAVISGLIDERPGGVEKDATAKAPNPGSRGESLQICPQPALRRESMLLVAPRVVGE